MRYCGALVTAEDGDFFIGFDSAAGEVARIAISTCLAGGFSSDLIDATFIEHYGEGLVCLFAAGGEGGGGNFYCGAIFGCNYSECGS